MRCAILSIGTELTRGDLLNANAKWLAAELAERGYEVTEIATIDDDEPRIVETLLRLATSHDVIISTGGLGPTTDDLTTVAVAKAAGVPLVRDVAALEHIGARVRARGRAPSPSNDKQADFPEGAAILPNPNGTAPGFSVSIGAARAHFLPGVPGEMRPMFQTSVVPTLPPPVRPLVVERLRAFGVPESELNDRLAGIEAELGVTIGYRASRYEVELKVIGTDRAAVQTGASIIRERIGQALFGDGRSTLAATLGQELKARGLRLALAESCTGGLVSSWMTAESGSSGYYLGGVTSYANSAKEALLGVPHDVLQAHGAVSEAVARAMAEGAVRAFDADVGVSLTGVAGPTGGSEKSPVGRVHFAVAKRVAPDAPGQSSSKPNAEAALTTVAAFDTFPGSRSEVQTRAGLSALWLLHEVLHQGC